MTTLPNIIQIGIALGGFFLAILTIWFAYHLHKKEKELHEKEHIILTTGSKLIDHAQNKANDILETAADKAKETLMQTQFVKADISKDMNKALEEVSHTTIEKFKEQAAEFDNQYRDLLQQMKQEYAANARGTISRLDNAVTKEIEDFGKMLKEETMTSQEVLNKDIGEAFEQAKKEIEAYKKAKMLEADTHLNKVLSQILAQVLHKSLSGDDHQKLIMQALEQARREGVFGTVSETPFKKDSQ
jgi:gas vesicle protein